MGEEGSIGQNHKILAAVFAEKGLDDLKVVGATQGGEFQRQAEGILGVRAPSRHETN